LKDGNIQWVLIHVEVQARFESDFAKRMFLYKAFIFAKYQLPIVALAIYPTRRTPPQWDVYEESFHGTTLNYRFNAYKIGKQNEADLMESDNIFALFVLANLYVIKTEPKKNEVREAYDQRTILKEKLFQLAREKDIPKEKIDRMLIFVNEIVALPIDLQTAFMENVITKKSKTRLTPLQKRLAQSQKDFFKAFFTAEMGIEPDVYFAQQKASAEQAQAAQAAQAENEKLINQIYIAIQMRRQLDLEAAKVALIVNMPLDQIQFIFRHEVKKHSTAELLLPLFKQYVAAKLQNPTLNPLDFGDV
jgi:hypothetical protein